VIKIKTKIRIKIKRGNRPKCPKIAEMEMVISAKVRLAKLFSQPTLSGSID